MKTVSVCSKLLLAVAKTSYANLYYTDYNAYQREWRRHHKEKWLSIQMTNYRKNLKVRRKKMKEKADEYLFDSKRQVVLRRDNFTCQICFKKLPGKNLCVHHKDLSGNARKIRAAGPASSLGKEIRKTVNNDLNNLLTLCNSCHMKLHWQLTRTRII